MKTIYVSHSRSFDFKKDLYPLLRKIEKGSGVTFILPHEKSDEPMKIQSVIPTCDAIFAEVSFPSTGQGFDLMYGYMVHIPIFCFYRYDHEYSGSLSTVTQNIKAYKDESDLINKVKGCIQNPYL